MIIDYTYFTGLLSVGLCPDTGAPSMTQDVDRERIQSYIDVYERVYLNKILGEEMYGQFTDYLNSRQNSKDKEPGEPATIEKWEKLYILLSEKYSPIACYVFFKYVAEGNYSVTRSGTVTSADDDAVSPEVLQIRAWNDMVSYNQRVYRLLQEKEYEGVRFSAGMIQKINSLGI